jgi:protein tyrosine phosphatase (PTP) superfamily phosphohydrolase (DUF442 family)
MPTLRSLVVACALSFAPCAPAQVVPLAAPNVLEISPLLVTSGQPSAETLAGLKAQGFEVVIYLAPPTVNDAVRDEHFIVSSQGLAFINIPIRWENPTESDFEAFAGVLRSLATRKVLVHCQLNYRASSMVFLYRVVVLKEDPAQAYEAVARVWTPSGPWRILLEEQLHKHRIAFELL